ncbi:cyclic peptide export ABC transporter [Thalassomonas viridans]|uniref:Cyclic peptide export ABC transporter n=1 Tax=Thalassomonas viridans TaxID=137584 RepID=A0AAF0CAZ7_9GAMM|nr:cyclic peptide export ABC transporter [Thalassomonas viridans]WDE09177.1 cyclic peptide export ABC transporter [Thalassomonas viridans]
MSILSTFSRKAPNRVFVSVILGALAGVCYSALIPLVLSSISPADPNFAAQNDNIESVLSFDVMNYKLAALYLVACLAILLMRSASEIILVRVASEVARELRVKFYRQIANAPLASIEKIGSAKFIAAINIDVPRIVTGGRALPVLLVNGITLIGMLGFLLYLNADVFKLVMVAIFVGAVCYQLPMMLGSRIFQRSREAEDKLQESIKGLLFGVKELKLDSNKRGMYFKKALLGREEAILGHEKKAQTIVRATMSFGDLISFFVIGGVGFIFVNYYAITPEELIGVVMALLYVTAPIALLLGAIPAIAVASISYRKLNRLIEEIPHEDINPGLVELNDWQSLTFNQVEFRYPSDTEEPGFHIGPLDFEINKGEITFIVGGNGSGKSTLSKLLTLHYMPQAGNISFGENEVNAASVTSHRQNIGAIYTDYFLFDELLMDFTGEVTAKANEYLRMLHLDKKVKIENGAFTTLSLSDGQRKRLALLVALLEEKQFYLFDEWAADQDPEFKEIFYNKILPDMRAQGKAIVVISHDDRYFPIADKILVMEQGRLVKTPSQVQLPEQETAIA